MNTKQQFARLKSFLFEINQWQFYLFTGSKLQYERRMPNCQPVLFVVKLL